jgi:hypothetical protein
MRDPGTVALVLILAIMIVGFVVAWAEFHNKTGRW